MSAVHICCPQTTAKNAFAATCVDCGKRTRMLSFFQPWYGWRSTCIQCGREWDDGHWLDLDFASGYWGHDSKGAYRFMKPREYNIESAKVRWRKLPPISENHYGLEL